MITINWGNEQKTVMQYEFEGSWTIDDLIEALDAGVEVVNRYEHDIDVVVDLTNSGFPNLLGVNVNKAFGRAATRSEEHIESSHKEPGIVVVVTTNPIIRSSLTSMLALYPNMGGSKMVVANTLDAAYDRIATYRQRDAVA
jgi:hypothetical protein